MRKLKFDFELIYILAIICMSDGLYYIFDEKFTIIIKNFSYIISIIVMFLCFFLYCKNKRKMNFKLIIVVLMFLVFIEPFNTYLIYGQPIANGYILNLKYLLYLNYFFISYYINKNDNNKNRLENGMIFISIISSIIYIIQFFILPKVILQGMGYRISYRFGEPRFYICTLLFAITLILALIKLLFTKTNIKYKIIYFSTTILNIFVLINISKTRSIMIAITICFILMIFLKIFRTNPIKAIIFVLIAIISIIFLSSLNSIKNMIDLTQNGDGTSMGIRMNELKFYFQQLKDNFILGRGEVNRGLYPFIDGVIYKYYLDDLGFIGIIIKFGIIGIVGILTIFIKIVKIIFVKSSEKISKIYIIFLLIYILIVGILIPYLDQGESIIFICIIFAYLDKIKNNKRG